MTPLSIFLAVAMIVGPFAWALLRCGALADKRYSEEIDKPIRETREAMTRQIPVRPYRPGLVKR